MSIAPFVMGGIGMLGSFAMVVLVVLVVFKHASTESRRRQDAFNAALEKGVYDPALLGRGPVRRGTAPLGWGLFFVAVGLALFIGFAVMGILGDALLGALVPLFIGLGLLLYHRLRGSQAADSEANGKPIQIAKTDAPRPGGSI